MADRDDVARPPSAGEPLSWGVVVAWLRAEAGRPGTAVDHPATVRRVAWQLEELVASAEAHVGLVRRSGGGYVAGPHKDSVERLEAALAGGLGKGVVFGDDLAEILGEVPADELVAELRRRGDGRVTMAGGLRDAGPTVEELLVGRAGFDGPAAGVPRGTCPALGSGSRRCKRPAAEGEENLCVVHAKEADEVGRMVLSLVRKLRWPDGIESGGTTAETLRGT